MKFHVNTRRTQIVTLMALVLATPAALAYGPKDAISDCEGRIRSEYKINDLRDAHAAQLDGDKHFRVEGKAKVDGDKYPWTCEVKNRHVIMAEYSGPKPKGLGTAEKLAIGAAAVAAGIAISEANQHSGEGRSSHSRSGASGAAGLQDLVGARGSSGEMELENRGYRSALNFKDGHSSFTNWRKGSHCVSVRTTNGHYDSIVDVGTDDCQEDRQRGGGEADSSGGGAGAADLQDLVGARGAGGETELQNRGYDSVAGNKWSNGWHCVTVHTADGRYKSIVDTPMSKCH